MKLSVVVVNYNQRQYARECIDSIYEQTEKIHRLVFIDNNSNDGSYLFITRKYPHILAIKAPYNTGYASGANSGLKAAFSKDSDAVLLLNTDLKLKKDAIYYLIKTYIKSKEKKIKVGLVQPTILLYKERGRINTVGNTIHYLGYGYCPDYGKKTTKNSIDKEIISVSGSAMMIPRDYYKKVGGFDGGFFMYMEDQDLSWRGLMMGYRHILSSNALVYHRYDFHRNAKKMYYVEKNRLMLILKNYSLRSLLVLSPALFVNELLVLCFAALNGWFTAKLKSYYFVIKNLGLVLKRRKIIQANRTIEDNKILIKFESMLQFPLMNNFVIEYIINPLYYLYYLVAVLFIFFLASLFPTKR